jgi:hypothetical protein
MITPTLLACNVVGNQTILTVGLALSGNYAAGGDTLDLTSLLGQGDGPNVFVANNPPEEGEVSASTGWIAAFIPGTQINNGKVKFVVTSTGVELAVGAYTAALAADPNIVGTILFDKLQ